MRPVFYAFVLCATVPLAASGCAPDDQSGGGVELTGDAGPEASDGPDTTSGDTAGSDTGDAAPCTDPVDEVRCDGRDNDCDGRVDEFDFRELTTGGLNTCGLDADGQVYCWGNNYTGSLGVGDFQDRSDPTPIDDETAYATIAAGGFVNCGVTQSSGQTRCWGYNPYGRLIEDSDTARFPTPTLATDVPRFASVVIGTGIACGLTDDGRALCWGDYWPQNSRWADAPGPGRVGADQDMRFRTLTAGALQVCGITTDGKTLCWGQVDTHRVTGNWVTENAPQRVDPDPGFADLASMGYRSCGVTDDGQLHCWGREDVPCVKFEQRRYCWEDLAAPGDRYLHPEPVSTPEPLVELSSGSDSLCGLSKDGNAYCMGGNDNGELGDGSVQDRRQPVAVQTDATFQALAPSGGHTCGLTTDGKTLCWGLGRDGQLGRSIEGGPKPPTSAELPADTSFTDLTVGAGFGCALNSDGRAFCWGYNNRGQLGDGTRQAALRPAPVDTDLRFTELSAGSNHVCGITTDGTAACWGDNRGGNLARQRPDDADPSQLGEVFRPYHTDPAPIESGGLKFRTLQAQWSRTCGMTTDGQLACWGANENLGELRFDRAREVTAADVYNGLDAVDFALGGPYLCVLKSDGTHECEGRNKYGEWGDGKTREDPGSRAFKTDPDFAEIIGGPFHSCGLTDSGKAYCWGRNSDGQVGNGQPVDARYIPAPVSGGHTWKTLSLGSARLDYHGMPEDAVIGGGYTCGLTTSGKAYCWGNNAWKRLGVDSPDQTAKPVAVATDKRFQTLDVGSQHACGLTEAGGVVCWGAASHGRLGDGTRGYRTTPVGITCSKTSRN